MPGQERNVVSPEDEAAIDRVRRALADAAARLAAAGARAEALAEYVPAGRTLLVPRAERLRPLGRVWRLGVLLLLASPENAKQAERAERADSPPVLFATGSLTRAGEPGRPTYVAASSERRRQLRVAAYRGHFAPGTSVNFDARPIRLDAGLVGASGPLTVQHGAACVRWTPSNPDALTPFDTYLAERVALLVTPPEGA